MGLLSSSTRKKSGVSFGHDHDDRHSGCRERHRPERSSRSHFTDPNPWHDFFAGEENSHHHRSRRSSHNHSRRAAGPSLSPTRIYEMAHSYRQRTRRPSRTRKHHDVSSSDFHANPFSRLTRHSSSRQRSASPDNPFASYGTRRRESKSKHHIFGRDYRRDLRDDHDLSERLAGFSMRDEPERRYGRRRPSHISKIERIYELD